MALESNFDRRLFVVGDELVTGIGDRKGLGWLGRVVSRTQFTPPALVFPLAVANEDTGQLRERWVTEVTSRLSPNPEANHKLIVALGKADLDAGITLSRSRLNLANILDTASEHRISSLVVGPPPVDLRLRRDLGELSQAFEEVSYRRAIPFIDTFNPLVENEQWRDDLAASGGPFPGQVGYGLLAWLVLNTGWKTWID